MRNILDKAAGDCQDPTDLKNHKSIIVRTAAKTMENKSLRRLAPESTKGICCGLSLVLICCAGFTASMGAPPPCPSKAQHCRLSCPSLPDAPPLQL